MDRRVPSTPETDVLIPAEGEKIVAGAHLGLELQVRNVTV